MKGKPMISGSTPKTCKFCGCLFQPSSKHPHQECCSSPQCRRAQSRIRQRRCAKKRKKDPASLQRLSTRKHKEYIRRKEHCNAVSPPPLPRPHITTTSVEDYFTGLLQIVVQPESPSEIYSLMERCRMLGRTLRL